MLITASGLGVSTVYVVPGMLAVSAATMSLTMNLTDRQRFTALLISCGSTAAAITFGTWAAGNPLLESLVFLGLGTATLLAFLGGPPAVVVAIAAIAAYYAMTLVPATWDRLSGNVISAVLGAALSAVLLGIFLRERPDVQARRLWFSIEAACLRLATSRSIDPRRQSARLIEHRVDAVLSAVTAAKAHLRLYPEAWPASITHDDASILTDLAIAAAEHAQPTTLPELQWPRLPARLLTRNAIEVADPGGRTVLSMGVQLLAATVLSLAAAQLIDPDHWFWCVLAALVMLFGTTSAADSIGKGLRRVIGTAAALPIGVVLADLVGPDLVWTAAIVLVAMFFQQYFADSAYGVSVFFLTVLLSLLLSVTSGNLSASLGARLLLTAIGATIGIGVALTVLPVRTRSLLRGRALGVVDAAESTVAALQSHAEPEIVANHAETTARRSALLRSEALAARDGWPFSARHNQALQQVVAAGDAARQLQQLAKRYQQYPNLTSTAKYQAERTMILLRQTREHLDRTRRVDIEIHDTFDDQHQVGRSTDELFFDDPLAHGFERLRVTLRSLFLQLS